MKLARTSSSGTSRSGVGEQEMAESLSSMSDDVPSCVDRVKRDDDWHFSGDDANGRYNGLTVGEVNAPLLAGLMIIPSAECWEADSLLECWDEPSYCNSIMNQAHCSEKQSQLSLYPSVRLICWIGSMVFFPHTPGQFIGNIS